MKPSPESRQSRSERRKEMEETLNDYFAPERKESEIKKIDKEKVKKKHASKDKNGEKPQVKEAKEVKSPEEITIKAIIELEDVDPLIAYLQQEQKEAEKRKGMPKLAQHTFTQEAIESRRGMIINDLHRSFTKSTRTQQAFDTIGTVWGGSPELTQTKNQYIDGFALYIEKLIHTERQRRSRELTRRLALRSAMNHIMSEFVLFELSNEEKESIWEAIEKKERDMHKIVVDNILFEAVKEEELMNNIRRILKDEELSEKEKREKIREEIAKYAGKSKQPPAEPVALEEPPKRGLLKRLRV